jgi:sulfur carrier protein
MSAPASSAAPSGLPPAVSSAAPSPPADGAAAPVDAAGAPPLPLVLNGQPDACAAGETVADLLGRLGLRRDGVAVALNGEVLPRSAWPARALRAGDRVELIHAVGGG